MMTKQTSTLKSLFLKLTVIPLVAGLTFSFSTYEESEILPADITSTNIPTTPIENEPQNQEITDAEYFSGVRFILYQCEIQGEDGATVKKVVIDKLYENLSEEDKKKFKRWTFHRQQPFKKMAPTTKELNDFKNSKKYAIWIDGVNVPNVALNKYKPEDIAHFSGSVILKNARTKKHPQPFQYWFTTHKHYDDNKMGEPLKKYPGDKIELTIMPKPQVKNEPLLSQEDKNPDYPGGMGEFMKYFAANFNYPKDLKSTEVLRLFVSFDVTKEGGINSIKMLKGHSKEVDEEVIRVLKASPKWIPGEKDGKKVDAQLTLPIQLQPR